MLPHTLNYGIAEEGQNSLTTTEQGRRPNLMIMPLLDNKNITTSNKRGSNPNDYAPQNKNKFK